MMNKFHTFHMISSSPWPIVSSIQTWNLMMKSTMNMASTLSKSNLIYLTMIFISSMMWWKNVTKEAGKEGYHQNLVMKGLKMGMILFILSEILFFTSFFWAYFHSSISPTLDVGQTWPPTDIKPFNPINVPLLNTLILISSGISITWSHHSILKKNIKKAKLSLAITCLLGVYFSLLQGMEYMEAEFSLNDSSYGSIFFMATGFHGLHVIIGSSFLITNLILINSMKVSNNHHIGFEMAAWYWHFVDIVWLFLYLSIYWWGM